MDAIRISPNGQTKPVDADVNTYGEWTWFTFTSGTRQETFAIRSDDLLKLLSKD
jgi:hypothetical protein